MSKSKNESTFRVYINQVNQTYVDVQATSEDSAIRKGYAKWRKEDAHSTVMSVTKITSDTTK